MNKMTNFIHIVLILFFINSYSYYFVNSLKSFNVVRHFGAKNDGKTDATQAFLNAWNVACSRPIPVKIHVPRGKYLLRPIRFEGGCNSSSILFVIDGALIASSSAYDSQFSWLVFHGVDGLYIKGGVLDAKGKSLWDCKISRQRCAQGAASLSFDNSKNIIVQGLTSTNSQMYHMTINACKNMNMVDMTIKADGESPNTDGIHMERSTGITIRNSQIMTGDDCISIGPNNTNIWIEDVFCGPGHGISIGSLGRDSDEGVYVQNVTVKSATFKGTDNGLRIKTFSSPIKGTVKDIYFLGATMTDVRNPILIDQNYCPQGNCVDEGSGIQISNVIYKNIHGSSSSTELVTFKCSRKRPCYGLTLQNISLYGQDKSIIPKCDCQNCYVKVAEYMQPSNCIGN